MSQMDAAPRLPNRKLGCWDWRLPRTQAIQRPSGDQANECISPPCASGRGLPPARSSAYSVSDRTKAMDFPSRDHPAGIRGPTLPQRSASGPVLAGTTSLAGPPSAETISMPRGEPNMMRPPSGDQDGKRWGRSLCAASVSALPPSSPADLDLERRHEAGRIGDEAPVGRHRRLDLQTGLEGELDPPPEADRRGAMGSEQQHAAERQQQSSADAQGEDRPPAQAASLRDRRG